MNREKAVNTIIALAGLVLAAAVLPGAASQELFRAVTNYPNPFDSRLEATTISYCVPADTQVAVRIYDLLGNLIREYPSLQASAGTNTLVWDGTDNDGDKVAKGGYLCVVAADHEAMQLVAIRKIGVIH